MTVKENRNVTKYCRNKESVTQQRHRNNVKNKKPRRKKEGKNERKKRHWAKIDFKEREQKKEGWYLL